MLCTSRKKIKFLCHNLGDGSICGGGGGGVGDNQGGCTKESLLVLDLQ